MPDWKRLVESDWRARVEPCIELVLKLALDTLAVVRTFRYRLCANPCRTSQGKRRGLVHPDVQRAWLLRKGEQHGLALPTSDTRDCFDFVESPAGQPYPDIRVSKGPDAGRAAT